MACSRWLSKTHISPGAQLANTPTKAASDKPREEKAGYVVAYGTVTETAAKALINRMVIRSSATRLMPDKGNLEDVNRSDYRHVLKQVPACSPNFPTRVAVNLFDKVYRHNYDDGKVFQFQDDLAEFAVSCIQQIDHKFEQLVENKDEYHEKC